MTPGRARGSSGAWLFLVALAMACSDARAGGDSDPAGPAADDWAFYGGDPGGLKYSTLADIDRDNVAHLELAWTWETGEAPIPGARVPTPGQRVAPGMFEATPVVVNDTMWVVTPYSRVVALDAATGAEFWSYDPKAYEWGPLARGCRFCHRGIALWSEGSERRVFLNSRWRLIALDAATGEPVPEFGHGGEVDLVEGLAWDTNRLLISNTSPAVVFEDIVIVGSGVPDDRVFRHNPPGDVQAFDARTGERLWTFHTVPREGEPGVETWDDGSWSYTGSANVWAPFSVDVQRGLVFLPVSTPNNDFYGGHRRGDNLYAESLVCLDARTGERVWHFQTVRHGLWDYDLPAPPALVTIDVDGRTIDAVAVVGKTAFVYVFDRVTGEPVWPIEDRPVPASDVPGERAAATQPFPSRPAPFTRQGAREEDLIDFTPELRAEALAMFRRYRSGPLFTPPSLEGTIMMPGVIGGAGWGGGAVDPERGVLYVKGFNAPFLARVRAGDPETSDADYVPDFGGSLSLEGGLPLFRPPYSNVTAIDLNSGEHVWQVTFGDDERLRDHPRLRGLDLPPLGLLPSSHGSTAGPLVTAGGLLFLAGGAPELHALDVDTGATLWRGSLGGGLGRANPMTYRTTDGRQFVVVATSARGGDDSKLQAFALPAR